MKLLSRLVMLYKTRVVSTETFQDKSATTCDMLPDEDVNLQVTVNSSIVERAKEGGWWEQRKVGISVRRRIDPPSGQALHAASVCV